MQWRLQRGSVVAANDVTGSKEAFCPIHIHVHYS